MPLLCFSTDQSIASLKSGPRVIPIAPRLCSAMVLTMNAYKGWFTTEHLAKVRAVHGDDVFNGSLTEFAEAVLTAGAVEVAFAPRYANSAVSMVQPGPQTNRRVAQRST